MKTYSRDEMMDILINTRIDGKIVVRSGDNQYQLIKYDRVENDKAYAGQNIYSLTEDFKLDFFVFEKINKYKQRGA